MQIRALEDELGSALFIRTSRSVKLTTAGRLFLIEAQRTVAQADRAREAVEKAGRGQVGTVRIAFGGNAEMAGRLPDDLRRFTRQYPHVALELHECAPIVQADALESGHLDIGYSHAFGAAYEFRLRTDVLASWPWVVALSCDHPLAAFDAIPADALRDSSFILYGRPADDIGQLMAMRLLLKREPQATHRVESALTVLALAAAGLGLALVPQPISTIIMPGLVFRPIREVAAPTSLVLLSREDETAEVVVNFRRVALGSAS